MQEAVAFLGLGQWEMGDVRMEDLLQLGVGLALQFARNTGYSTVTFQECGIRFPGCAVLGAQPRAYRVRVDFNDQAGQILIKDLAQQLQFARLGEVGATERCVVGGAGNG